MIEEIIINKIDEINKEYNIIIQGGDLDFINLCRHQNNAMINVLEEILNDVKKLPDYKSAWNELKNKTNEELEQATWAGAGLNDTKISMQELEQKYNLGGE